MLHAPVHLKEGLNMREIRHWHVVEEKAWEGDCYRHSYTWRPAQVSEQEFRELERIWAQKRLLEAKRTLLESMAVLGNDVRGVADIAEFLGGRKR
jgi:hypothetical protein